MVKINKNTWPYFSNLFQVGTFIIYYFLGLIESTTNLHSTQLHNKIYNMEWTKVATYTQHNNTYCLIFNIIEGASLHKHTNTLSFCLQNFFSLYSELFFSIKQS